MVRARKGAGIIRKTCEQLNAGHTFFFKFHTSTLTAYFPGISLHRHFIVVYGLKINNDYLTTNVLMF